jgi:hypothetical protein
VLGLLTFYALLSTPDMGFTRDEGFYFHAGKDYVGWFEELEKNIDKGQSEISFTQANIDKYWSYNPEHPALPKALFGLSYRSFSQTRDWLEPSTAMRMPTMAFVAVLIYLLYLFVAEAFNRMAAFAATLALMLMPHVWIHSHFSCFDAAMMTMWFAVPWAYWKSLRSWPWAIATGVIFGIALSVKLNAFFLPFPLLAHWALNGLWSFRLERDASAGTGDGGGEKRASPGLQLRLPRVPLAFYSMATLGPLVFYLLWPRHWYETFPRIAWYFERHLGHEHYPVDFFGAQHLRPPFPMEYPFVMSWYTIPLVILFAFFLGLAVFALHRPWRAVWAHSKTRLRGMTGGPLLSPLLSAALATLGRGQSWRERYCSRRAQFTTLRERALLTPAGHADPRGTMLLVLICSFVPFAVIALPSTPIFGGVKHWMTAMPFMAAVAGVGVVWCLESLLVLGSRVLSGLRRPLIRGGVVVALLAFVMWPNLRELLRSHPYSTSYFNELMGGYIGAADAGMQRQFWGYIARPALPYINEHAAPKAPVHFHDTLYYAYEMYLEDGLLREDVGWAWSIESAQYVIYHHERAFHPFLFEVWERYRTESPVHVVSIDGVPLVSIYENPDWRSPPR